MPLLAPAKPKIEGLVLDVDLSLMLPTVNRGRIGDQSIKGNHGVVYGRPAGAFTAAASDRLWRADSTGLRFGTGDFQIHVRAKMSSSQSDILPTLCSVGNSDANDWYFAFYEGHISFHWGVDPFYLEYTDVNYNDDTFHTFSVVRHGTDLNLLVDGVVVATTNNAGADLSSIDGFFVGSSNATANWYADCHITKVIVGLNTMTLAEGTAEAIRVHDGYLTSNPAGEWLFTEGSGGVADSSGNGLNLTASGMGWDLGANGGDLDVTAAGRVFDGTDDYIPVADATNLSFGDGTDDSPFSVIAWVDMSDPTEFPIIAKGVYNTSAEYRLLVDAADKIHFQCFDESVADCYIGRKYDTALSAGTLYCIVATYSGSGASSGVSIYINGVKVDDADSELNAGSYVAMEDLAADVHIGRNDALYADGTIKSVKIVRRELTVLDALAIFKRGVNG